MSGLRFAALAALLGACAHAPSRCRSVEGAAALFAPGRVVLVGEVHGTQEMPRLFTDLVCRAAQDEEVVVGFEYEPAIGAAVDRYLSAKDDRAERVRIVGPRIAYGDGSASVAMTDAFEALRRIARATRHIQVFGFRTAVDDAAYAENIEAAQRAHPQAVVLAYLGAGHARLTRDVDDTSDPTGRLLRARGLDVRSVAIDWTGGHAYLRGPKGPGLYADEPDHRAGHERVVVPYGSPKYDFGISVGRIHASWPVR